ncbi:S1-C subfamily serine protease [Sinorhizobium fredii]
MRKRYLLAGLSALVLAATAAVYPAYGVSKPATATSVVKVMLKGGHGSGVHIGNGYYLSAAHVTKDAKSVSLKTSNGRELPAEVLWSNPQYDITLLHAASDNVAASRLSCGLAAVGDGIKASGNPIAVEFVSAFGQIGGMPREAGPWKSVYVTNITTVMGMSGGPVFDDSGEVIGINVGVMAAGLQHGNAVSPSLTGFGFVVPSSEVCRLMGRV